MLRRRGSPGRRPPALDCSPPATFVLVVVAFLWPADFYYHYAGVPRAVPGAGHRAAGVPRCSAALARRPAPPGAAGGAARPRRRLAAATLAILAVAAGIAAEPPAAAAIARLPEISAAERIIPPGACVLTDQVVVLIAINRFISRRPGLLADGRRGRHRLRAVRRPQRADRRRARRPPWSGCGCRRSARAQYVWLTASSATADPVDTAADGPTSWPTSCRSPRGPTGSTSAKACAAPRGTPRRPRRERRGLARPSALGERPQHQPGARLGGERGRLARHPLAVRGHRVHVRRRHRRADHRGAARRPARGPQRPGRVVMRPGRCCSSSLIPQSAAEQQLLQHRGGQPAPAGRAAAASPPPACSGSGSVSRYTSPPPATRNADAAWPRASASSGGRVSRPAPGQRPDRERGLRPARAACRGAARGSPGGSRRSAAGRPVESTSSASPQSQGLGRSRARRAVAARACSWR